MIDSSEEIEIYESAEPPAFLCFIGQAASISQSRQKKTRIRGDISRGPKISQQLLNGSLGKVVKEKRGGAVRYDIKSKTLDYGSSGFLRSL
jgi:hypothetical protein